MAACRRCRQRILWGVTEAGQNIALQRDPGGEFAGEVGVDLRLHVRHLKGASPPPGTERWRYHECGGRKREEASRW